MMKPDKRGFALKWQKVAERIRINDLAGASFRARTRKMIGRGIARLQRKDGDPRFVQRVLAEYFENEHNLWYAREIFSVDVAVLQFNTEVDNDPWGIAYEHGMWTTCALIEHENQPDRPGLLATVRKLIDYRPDVLRVAIGYCTGKDGDPSMWQDEWHKVLEEAPSGDCRAACLESLLLVARAADTLGGEWQVYGFESGIATSLR